MDMNTELEQMEPVAPVWTDEQRSLADEFLIEYGIEPTQINFNDDQLNPIFDFDALFFLANRLGDFWDIGIEAGDVDHERGYCTSHCCITLADGRTRKMFGSAFIGEPMPGARTVQTIGEALVISRARALRGALRAVGFDPLRAHLQRGSSDAGEEEFDEYESPRRLMERQAHLLGEKLGYIVRPHGAPADKSEWREFMAMLFHGKTSMSELTDDEQSQWVSTLRAMERACQHAVAINQPAPQPVSAAA
jgi:hypothetical protein